jgi:SAM-dependent methyltransferase
MIFNKDYSKHEKIGNVDFYALEESVGDKRYSDGDIEDKILDFFKKDLTKDDVDNVLDNNPTWAEKYHLTPVRENLLSWSDFDSNKSLLEVGSGAGAVTGVFCRNLKNVVAVELTYRRAQITAHRHKKNNNLTVVAGNINSLSGDQKFDYVTSIGVLEYAGQFSDSENPFLEFLETLYGRLNDGGTLIIAIENKFGLKYWAGCREDHTGRLFDSIEGYPSEKDRQTFGKKEIEDLIANAGFSDVDFYYPMPDYKLPMEIFSEKYKPSELHSPRSSHYPFVDYTSHPDEVLFNQRLVMNEIIKNDQFGFFANSFLIFANKK